jgi:hypothetical protein
MSETEEKEGDLTAEELQGWVRTEARRLRIAARERLEEAREIVKAKAAGATEEEIGKMLSAHSGRWNEATSVEELRNKINARLWGDRVARPGNQPSR